MNCTEMKFEELKERNEKGWEKEHDVLLLEGDEQVFRFPRTRIPQ